MPDVVLGSEEQTALCELMSAEPVPGRPLPERRVLHMLNRLIPCDAIACSYSTSSGALLDSVGVPDGYPARLRRQQVAGLHHLSRGDSLRVMLHDDLDHEVYLWLARLDRAFGQCDVALLTMVLPALRRLARERAMPHLPENLTVQERRVLMLVAAGCTNAEIGQRLSVEPCTVRKHLEHAYRKLGVTSRLGAVAAVCGGELLGPDLQARAERFA